MTALATRLERRVTPARLRGDGGSAVVEFALVSVLLVLLLFAVVQVAALLYVRSVVSAATSDGAHFGASAGAPAGSGARRATALIARGLGAGLARAVSCDEARITDGASGLAVDRVRCSGRLTSLVLPLAAFVSVTATADSVVEQP